MSDPDRSSPQRPPAPEPVIHIHEDAWGIRNVYPLAARAEVSDDLAQAAADGAANRAPAGGGWTDVHVIKTPADDYVATGLLVSQVAAALAPIMPRIKRFYATSFAAFGREERDPWGSYEDEAWCFGFGRRCFVKIDADGESVRSMWFDLNGGSAADAEALGRALQAIDALAPSLIADYELETQTPIADRQALAAYLRDLSGAGRA